MLWEPIIKSSPRGEVAPNLRNYEQARVAFSWEEARSELDGLPDGGGLNIAHEAVDRHAAGALRDKAAIRWSGKDGSVRDFSFARLRDLTNRFANALGRLGIGKGDRVYALMGRVPELYVTALGAFKNRSVFCPLFSAFGPEPIKARVNIGGAKVLVTTESLYYPPQVAIVGFGKVVERPWAVNGMIGARQVMTATLAADHRASDGHRGGMFLAAMDRLLQEPEKL
jgi:acetyl-CoA synthetase